MQRLILAAVIAFQFITPTAHAERLSFQVRTEQQPQLDFVAARAVLESEELSSPVIRTSPVFTDSPTDTGFRFVELDVRSGRYTAFVDLLDRDGDAVASSETAVIFDEDFTVSVFIPKPDSTASLTVFLLTDADASGGVSVGDVVRFVASLDGEGGVSFEEAPGASLAIVEGSVMAEPGVVIEGNKVDDGRIVVAYDPPLVIEEGATVQ